MIEALIVSLIIGAMHFWIFSSLMLALIVTTVNWVIWTYLIHRFKWMKKQVDTQITMYYLIHSVITTLAIKGHLHESVFDVMHRLPGKLRQWEQYISDDGMTTLINLNTLFPYGVYRLCIASLQFYESQGGEVMSLFGSFLQQTRIMETRLKEEQSTFEQAFVQFIILWLFNLAVIILAKFSLQYMFSMMSESLIFVYGLTLVFILFPSTVLLYIQKFISTSGSLKRIQ